jgi:energy-coupling factor transporter ATP-binding protein EcfA2
MRSEIRRLHDAFRITTVYVTHDQSEAMVTSDRIVVMNKGRIEQIDAPHALYGRPKSRFVAGFIGRTNFIEGDSRNGEIAFGGQIAYLWRSNLGAEFLADFAPTFKIPSLVISDHPSLSAYMFNAIYGFRIGSGGRFKPYISGGIGWINMSADLLAIDTNLIQSTITASQSRFGGDVGVGTMGYVGKVGIRADIRWFKANSDTTFERLTDRDRALLDNDRTLVELSGIKYWRSSLGVAFRW